MHVCAMLVFCGGCRKLRNNVSRSLGQCARRRLMYDVTSWIVILCIGFLWDSLCCSLFGELWHHVAKVCLWARGGGSPMGGTAVRRGALLAAFSPYQNCNFASCTDLVWLGPLWWPCTRAERVSMPFVVGCVAMSIAFCTVGCCGYTRWGYRLRLSIPSVRTFWRWCPAGGCPGVVQASFTCLPLQALHALGWVQKLRSTGRHCTCVHAHRKCSHLWC